MCNIHQDRVNSATIEDLKKKIRTVICEISCHNLWNYNAKLNIFVFDFTLKL